jgi:regulator of sigma E protease
MAGLFDTGGSILVFLAVLLVLVIWHELGHFTTAKLFKVTVQEFGVGYPPKVFGKMFRGTEYTVNLLPLGGFVRMVGEEDPNEPGSLASKSVLQRLIVLSAGSAMNAILPVILLTGMAMVPRQVLVQPILVGTVAEGSPAASQGIKPGDQIIKMNGRDIRGPQDLAYNLQLNAGTTAELTLRREGSTGIVREPRQTLTARVPLDYPSGFESAGIAPGGMSVTIEDVAAGSPAEVAGIRMKDVLLSVGGEVVASTRAVQAAIAKSLDKPVSVEVQRDGQKLTLSVTPRSNPPEGQGAAGIRIAVLSSTPGEVVEQAYGFPEALGSGLQQTFDMPVMMKNFIVGGLTAPKRSSQPDSGPALTGPIGIAQVTSEVAKLGGLTGLILLTAQLSMNLAIMNILPIPALDGGRVVFVLLEWVRRGRRVSPRVEGYVHAAGMAVLLALIVIISIGDIQRIIGGGSVIR